jgi:hypothetical protein
MHRTSRGAAAWGGNRGYNPWAVGGECLKVKTPPNGQRLARHSREFENSSNGDCSCGICDSLLFRIMRHDQAFRAHRERAERVIGIDDRSVAHRSPLGCPVLPPRVEGRRLTERGHRVSVRRRTALRFVRVRRVAPDLGRPTKQRDMMQKQTLALHMHKGFRSTNFGLP